MRHTIEKYLLLFLVNIFIFLALVIMMVMFSGKASAQVVYEGTKNYRVTAVKSGDHKISSLSNIAKAAPPIALFVPNVFTPNNDGMNDKFGVSGQNIKEFEMTILNRWGEVVFHTTNVHDLWDGIYQGQVAGNSVYVYQITAKGYDGEETAKTGNITILL
jgi:gliding motility-associated-like protein